MTSDFSEYTPLPFLTGGHAQTIFPALLRKPKLSVPYIRQRVHTLDGDFLDLDWLQQGAKNLVIISHGLEGSSSSPYVLGMARALFDQGFDVLAWNFRSCSGEINLGMKMYHSGATEDLGWLVDQVAKDYECVHLVGFSLGGNLTLKYLGEMGNDSIIDRTVVFSVPLDLNQASNALDKGFNRVYASRFLNSLKRKIWKKHQQFPKLIPSSKIQNTTTLFDFDEHFTAPLHGFDGALDYYTRCSAKLFLEHIRTPTWIFNAANDPMIGPFATSPSLQTHSADVRFILSESGGHCGFPSIGNTIWWPEKVAIEALTKAELG